jgi:hypothetical protein
MQASSSGRAHLYNPNEIMQASSRRRARLYNPNVDWSLAILLLLLLPFFLQHGRCLAFGYIYFVIGYLELACIIWSQGSAMCNPGPYASREFVYTYLLKMPLFDKY